MTEKPTSHSSSLTQYGLLFVSSIIVSLISYFVIGLVGNIQPIPAEVLTLSPDAPIEVRNKASAAQAQVDMQNSMVWFGITGAILSVGFAAVVGRLNCQGNQIAIGVLSGLVLGGILGAVAATLAHSVYVDYKQLIAQNPIDYEHIIMLMHACTWGLIGLAVGIAAGINFQHRTLQCLFTVALTCGIMGGLAGGLFSFLAGIAFPNLNSASPIPAHDLPQLLWIAIPSMLIALGLGVAMDQASSGPSKVANTVVEH